VKKLISMSWLAFYGLIALCVGKIILKYALAAGKRRHIQDVERGAHGFDCWFQNYEVVACKGNYMQYWKYCKERPDLPAGYENETEWHAVWKSLVKDEFCEVVSGNNNEHRADIRTPKVVIEIQNSGISFDVVKERVNFYHNLTNARVIWIVNAYAAMRKGYIRTEYLSKNISKVTWKYPKKWARDISGWEKTEVYLDVTPRKENMLKIWLHDGELYGRWVRKQEFYENYLRAYSEQTDSFAEIFKSLNAYDY